MEILFRNQVNITIFLVLIFVLFIGYHKLDRSNPLNRSFILTIIGVMVGLFAESTTSFLDGHSSTTSVIINQTFSVILFIIAPIMAFNFFFFIYRLVFQEQALNKALKIILFIPIGSNIIFSLLSPAFGLFFEIDQFGVYTRGPLWILSAFSTYLYVVAGIVLVIRNYKRMLKQDFWLVLGVGVIPAIGGIIQSLIYGILTMWSSAGIALVIAYLFLQEHMIRLDALTGAWNRESFFNTYTRMIQLNPETCFGAIYFDIDNLKSINDQFGHIEGDRAIKEIAKITHQAIPMGHIMCRLGGDEFIIILHTQAIEDIQSSLKRIKQALNNRNHIKNNRYTLDCSFSTALFTKEFNSLNALLSKLDYLMYQEKNAKKKIA